MKTRTVRIFYAPYLTNRRQREMNQRTINKFGSYTFVCYRTFLEAFSQAV